MEKKNTWYLYALNFLAFFAIALVNTQMIPFLTSVGYDVVTRGYILAANSIVAIAGQFLFGYLCDKFKGIRLFFIIAYGLLVISSIAMFLNNQQVFWYHLCTVAIMGGMVKVLMGLDETWMLEIDSDNYGNLRAAGALGLTIGSPIAGYLVKEISYFSLIIALAITSILLIVFLLKAKDVQKKEATITMKSLKKLLHNYPYLLLVFIYLLVYMIGTADQYVVIDKMLDLDAGNTLVGIKWALQSFMEIPLFLLAGKILKRFQPSTLLIFGTIMYAVKFVSYAYASESWWIVATASLQIVTLPIIMLTSKVLVKAVTPSELASSAQMFAMAIFIGVSGLITPIITSYLSNLIGYNATLYWVAAFSIVPLACIFLYLHVQRKQLQEQG